MEALLEREGQVENWNDDRLDELSRRMDAGFAEMATKVELTGLKNEMNLRFDEIDRRFEGISGHFEGVNERFEGVNRRFGEVDKRFDRVEGQLDRVNKRLDYMLGGMFLAGAGLLANLLADKI